MTVIKEKQTCDVAGESVTVDAVRVVPFATREGKTSTRRSAVLSRGSVEVEVEEGSVLTLGDRQWVVARICHKGGEGVVRLRPEVAKLGRFEPTLQGFNNAGRPFDLGMLYVVTGVGRVNDVLGRLDEHPDVVGTFSDPLRSAARMLELARNELSDHGASAPLLAYIDSYLALCGTLVDICESSTQEREIDG